MARRGGKNEVTLTFAGDADQLERAIAKANGATDKFEGDIKQASKSAESSFDKIGNAAKSVGDDLDSAGRESARALDKMGDSARDLEKDLEKVGDSRQTFSRLRLSVEEVGEEFETAEKRARRLDRVIGEGGRSFGEYGRGLGGVGDRFDELDTRAMGVADAFAGLADAQKWSTLTAQEQAMVFSDLGSAMYNAVIPSLQDGAIKVRNFIDGMKSGEGIGGKFRDNLLGIGVAAAGIGAVVAVAALAWQDYQQEQQEARERAEEFRDTLDDFGGNVESATAQIVAQSDAYGVLRRGLNLIGMDVDTFSAQLENGTFNLELMKRAYGDNWAANHLLEQQYGNLIRAQEEAQRAWEAEQGAIEGSTEALRQYQEELRSTYDPIFGMIDAQRESEEAQQRLREATEAYDEAVREHGANSEEAAEAQRELTDAQVAARDATINLEGAALELAAGVRDGTIDIADARAEFIRMALDAGYTKGEIQAMAGGIGLANREADRISGRHARMRVEANVRDAINHLWGVNRTADQIDGRRVSITVAVRQAAADVASMFNIFGGRRAEGGAVAGGKLYEVAEQGKAELLEMGGRTYLIPGADGTVIPSDEIGMGGMGMGGPAAPTVVNNWYVQGSLLAERDLLKLVNDERARGGFARSLA